MNLSRKKNSLQIKGVRLASFLAFGFLSVFLLASNNFNTGFNNRLSLKFYNLLYVLNGAIYGNITYIYKNALTSKATIKNLEEQVEKYSLVKNQNTLLKIENQKLKYEIETLKNTFNFTKNYFSNRKYYFTSVYLKSSSALHQALIVDLGSKDGVLETSLAITQNGVLGYVSKVYENYLEILPLTANEAKIPAFLGKSKINGIVEGKGSLYPVFKSYEDTVNLIEGEYVYTSGIGGVFDKNVPIGKLIYKDHVWKVELFSSVLSIRDIIIVNRDSKNNSLSDKAGQIVD